MPDSDSLPDSFVVRRWSFVIGLLVLLAFAILIPTIGRAQEQPPNRAGVVIRHGDGRVVTACVSFDEPQISGTDLLDRAGIPFVAQQSSLGAAVCQVDGEGCAFPTEDCFCQCKGADCIYWIYHHLTDGAWRYSQISASKSTIRPGDVDGWAWGPGTNQGGAQPPALSFGEVCPAPGAEPSPVPPSETAPPPPPPTETTAPVPTVAPPSPTSAPPTAAPALPTQTTSVAAAPTASTTPAPATAPTTAPSPSATQVPPTVETATSAPPTREAQPTNSGAGGAITTPAPTTGGASAISYLAFGALALLLGGGIIAALLRRREQ